MNCVYRPKSVAEVESKHKFDLRNCHKHSLTESLYKWMWWRWARHYPRYTCQQLHMIVLLNHFPYITDIDIWYFGYYRHWPDFNMQLQLQVVSACTIKRKKPFPLVKWAGRRDENVLLLDKGKCSILYLKDGKTKRRVSPIVTSVNASTLAPSVSAHGKYVDDCSEYK